MLLRTKLSRDSWAALDTARVHPDTLVSLSESERPGSCSRVSVKLGDLQTSFWVVPDAAVTPGCLQIPLWPAMIFHLSEDSCAEVRQCFPSRKIAVEVYGPYVAGTEGPMVPFIILGMSSMKDAICRQLSRSPCDLEGMTLAVRLLGYVCAFQIREVCGQPSDSPCTALDLKVHQHLLSCQIDGSEETRRGEEAVEKGLAAISVNTGTSSLALPFPVLFEGGPPACKLQAFLQMLDARWTSKGGCGIIHLPIVDMCWELVQNGGSAVSFGKYLLNFLANLLPGWRQRVGGEALVSGQCGQQVVFLGSLDGPLPIQGKQLADFQSNLWPLRALRSTAVVLGVCSSKAEVHPLFRDYFLEIESGHSGSLPNLGFQAKLGHGRAFQSSADATSVTVVGCDNVLHELETTVVQYFRSLEVFHGMGIAWPPRTLLHGPPGSGKSHLLRWLSSQVEVLGVRVSWLRPSDVLSRYLGESEERLRLAFAGASQGSQPGSLLLIEGLDDFVRPPAEDSSFHNRMAATFLTLLDGIDSPVSAPTSCRQGRCCHTECR